MHELADGVFVWLQPGGESGVSNAGAIVDDDGITVVDTLMVRSQWEPFAHAVERLDRPVRRLVLTHAHIDHVGGSRAFATAGARVAGFCSAAKTAEIQADIESSGGEGFLIEGRPSNPADAERLVQDAVDRFVRIRLSLRAIVGRPPSGLPSDRPEHPQLSLVLG